MDLVLVVGVVCLCASFAFLSIWFWNVVFAPRFHPRLDTLDFPTVEEIRDLLGDHFGLSISRVEISEAVRIRKTRSTISYVLYMFEGEKSYRFAHVAQGGIDRTLFLYLPA